VNLDDATELLRKQIWMVLGKNLEKGFEVALKRRAAVLPELFEIGLTSKLRLNETLPIDVRIEQVRKEMEDFAAELDVQIPSLPRKYKRLRSRLKGIAAYCNHLSAEHAELEIMVREKLRIAR
jgi:hypothetical protein